MSTEYPRQNRLAQEKSPYLLQHAANPVDWYPWGEEAFKKAKEEDRPIFLSIGYASCHWCHVMENESFEDESVAALMNAKLVNIKVDREELPDVDNLYMDFAQTIMPGAAGWPLNVFLTPDLKPFFATTYLPPVDKNEMMGLSTLIEKISKIWNSEEKHKVLAESDYLVQIFKEGVKPKGKELPRHDKPLILAEMLYQISDPVWGGLSGSPKFPIAYMQLFLLRHFALSEDARAIFIAEKTLDMMQRGGIYDHLGGGFSRYSIDEEWRIPHFEKMLYDNALLIDAHLELFQATQKDLFKKTAEETLLYVLEKLKSPEGPFYASQDADSEGGEGAYYAWSRKEIMKLLGETEGAIFSDFFGITENGNFQGKNLLYISLREAEFADMTSLDFEWVEEVIAKGKKRLLEERKNRAPPKIDDKVLVSWNGLMIHALAKASGILDNPNYLKQAKEAALFIKNAMFQGDCLFRRYRDNEVRYEAGLDDYAFLIRGLIELFANSQESVWLDFALKLNQILKERFKSEDGAYFYTEAGSQALIVRKCLYADGAEPSGNAVQCDNLLRLNKLTLNPDYLKDAEDILKGVKEFVDNYPAGYTYHLMNLEKYNAKEVPLIVVALDAEKGGEDQIKACLKKIYNPLIEVIYKQEDDQLLLKSAPYLGTYIPKDGKTTLYLCRNGVCEQPLTKMSDIQEAILKLGQKV